MKEIKMTARPWQPQDLLDDLQLMIDEQPDNYLNTDRETLCTAKAYLEEYFSKPKWIPVTERLPEDTLPRFSEVKQVKVLTALKSWNGVRTVRSQMRYRDTWCDEVRWRWKYSGSEVTHWMPLPEPPKGE